jgi:hypothetical protein
MGLGEGSGEGLGEERGEGLRGGRTWEDADEALVVFAREVAALNQYEELWVSFSGLCEMGWGRIIPCARSRASIGMPEMC